MLKATVAKIYFLVWVCCTILRANATCTYCDGRISCTQVDKELYLAEVYQLSGKIRESMSLVKTYSLEIINSTLPTIGSWIQDPLLYNGITVTELDVSRSKLNGIELDALWNDSMRLYALNFTYNRVGDFSFLKNLNKASRIYRLTLRGCRILELDTSWFPKLEYLDISQNLLTNLTHDVEASVDASYNNLVNVKINNAGFLNLSGNRKLASIANPRRTVLRGIDLSNLKSNFNESLLSNLRVSDSLVLKNNVIKKLDKSVFNLRKIITSGRISIDLSNVRLSKISDGYFVGYILKALNMSGNRIDDIGACAFFNASIEFLDLSYSRISRLRAKIFDHFRGAKLDLSKNRLRYLNKAFDNIDVKDIDLSFNPLKTLDGSIFKRTTRVESLNLSNTYVDDVASEALAKISALDISVPATFQPASMRGILLRNLTVRNSKINSLPESGFVALRNLEVLSFENTSVANVNNRCLKGLFNLRSLNVRSLIIGQFSKMQNFFEDMYSLSKLDLSHLYIDGIYAHSFIGLSNLVSLNLSGNRISNIAPRSFVPMAKLQTLDLSRNNLKTFDSGLVGNLDGLKYLNLSYNSLTNNVYQVQMFIQIQSLIALDLSNNINFAVLSGWGLYSLTRLQHLYLDGTSSTSGFATGLLENIDNSRLLSLQTISINNCAWQCNKLALVLNYLDTRKIRYTPREKVTSRNINGVAC